MPYPDRFYPVVDTRGLARSAWPRLASARCNCAPRTCADADALTLVREALADHPRHRTTKLVVNDYWQAAIDAGAQHLHLGQEDLADADVKAIRRAGLTLGLSTHDEAELETALRHDPDYVALGPIYPTTLKAMRFGPQGLAAHRPTGKSASAISRWSPSAASSSSRRATIFAAGADSIAVVSDVTRNPDPDARVRAWLEHHRATGSAGLTGERHEQTCLP